MRALLTPWMGYFLAYDPLPELRRLRVPVLALNGEKDTQVPVDANLGAVEEALRRSESPDVTARRVPGFSRAGSGAGP